MSSWDYTVDKWGNTHVATSFTGESTGRCYPVPRMYRPKPEVKVVPWRHPQGPDPRGVPFLPMKEWEGVVDGYIYRDGELGLGYYCKPLRGSSSREDK